MTKTEIEECIETLKFNINFVEISKLKVLKEISQERDNLRELKQLKDQNASLIENLNKRWFNKISNIYRPTKSALLFGEKKELFILIDPIQDDKYSEVILSRFQEQMQEQISQIDYVITVGNHVNKLARMQELNIIEHLKLKEFIDIDEFAEKIGALVDIGLKYNVFNHVSLKIAQVDLFTNQMLVRKLIPIAVNDEASNPEINNYTYDDEEEKAEKADDSFIKDHNKIFATLDIKATKWFPNVNTFYEQFSKTVIKQDIFEFKTKSDIEELNKRLQVLDEKTRLLEEEITGWLKKLNRLRKEEMTAQSLLLYSAFRVKKEMEHDQEKIADFRKKQRAFALAEMRKK